MAPSILLNLVHFCPATTVHFCSALDILLLLAAVFGLGEAVVTSSAAALVADFCKEDNLGSAMGTFGTIFDVGHASGPLLAGLLIGIFSAGTDYRIPFAIVATLLILAALIFRAGVDFEPHG